MAGFRKASRAEQFLRMAIQGASGSGKTRSALEIAKNLAGPGGKIALIDTEHSAALYSDVVDFDIDDDFGAPGKENYHQDVWKKKILAACEAGYKVLILDSATHLWKGPGGFLAQIEAITQAQKARGGKYDTFAAWKTVDPLYSGFMQFIRALPMHVIFCVRSKTEYERVTEGGKGSLKKVGLSPEFRENYEYELDIQCSIDTDHVMVPLKHRLGDALDGKVFSKPGKEFADICLDWLASGAASAAKAAIEKEAQAKLEEATAPTLPQVPVAQPSEESEPNLDPITKFVRDISLAESADALKIVADNIKAALKDKTITQDDYVNRLSPAYSTKNKALKAAG